MLNTGYVNVILNLAKVKTLDSIALNAIVYAYKALSEVNGSLRLCGVNNSVNDELSYVFLNNLISIFKDKDSAIFDYRQSTTMNSL